MLQANLGYIFARHERIKNEKNFFVLKGKDFVEGFLFGVKPLRKFLHLFWEDEELAGARWAMEELSKLP